MAGCEPDEMGIGPVFAIPRCSSAWAWTVNDIDLWELNEAFAVQVLYCRDKLGIPPTPPQRQRRRHRRGPPYGCLWPAPHRPRALIEGKRRGAKRVHHHVHRRRHGCCWHIRSAVSLLPQWRSKR